LIAVIYKHSAPPELQVNARLYFGCGSAALRNPEKNSPRFFNLRRAAKAAFFLAL